MASAPGTPCPSRVQELVERFRQNIESYRDPSYKEAQVRKEFIDPLFAELGWDMDNTAGAAPQYRDVIHEDAISISGTTKAPDYCFTLRGARKFFVEAKKPFVNLLEDKEAAYQLRRYGWSAKLPLCILTDFEHLAVYDTRVRPKPGDPVSTARIRILHFEEYVKRWSAIEATFSYESVLKGRFDKEAARKLKRGTAEVDDAFLADIEAWRADLAANLKLRNQDLTQWELNYAVQALIDRIIFLRICEDRKIEQYGRLRSCAKSSKVYERLRNLFEEADAKYNSGLFHFHEEKERSSLVDTLTPGLKIDDKVLKAIISRLYYPESPYEFSILPTEVLGQVYEQFLGSVIIVTDKRARVEAKPEVKKAGGVFYTPSYIVDHIVKKTINPHLEGKKPGDLHSLRVVDPACGSGSFLLGAYQFLLDWHLDEYRKAPRKWKDRLNRIEGSDYVLTTDERSRILLDHIYGVDIDSQAVEVTKLSLLLKVLEKTPGEVLETQLKITHKRALPDLGANVKCGNTLLDYRHLGETLLDDETRRRVNPFDWKTEFPNVFADGGFDAVIGNPPYIRVQTMTEWAPLEVELYKKHYKAASKGNYDIYVCFVERGLWLLNERGRLGYILPHKFFNAKYGGPLRELISSGKHLAEVIYFGDQQIFQNATTYTCLLFLEKGGASEITFTDASDLQAWRLEGKATIGKIPSARVSSSDWTFDVGKGSDLFYRLIALRLKLGDIAAKTFQGLVTSADAVYLLDPVAEPANGLIRVRSKQTGKEYELETGVCWPLCKGSRDIRQYEAKPSKRVLFPYDPDESARTGKTVLIPEKRFATSYPKAWSYLQENKEVLQNREKGKMRREGWYGYVYPKSVSLFGQPKILTPSIAASASYTFDAEGKLYFVGSGGGGGGGYGIILKEDCAFDPRYVLALLNSHLLDFLLRRLSSTFRGGYYAYSRQFIELLPIANLDMSSRTEKTKHDELVELANRILDLKNRFAKARANHERTSLDRQMTATSAQIDALVYDLYGLSAEEAELVEGTLT